MFRTDHSETPTGFPLPALPNRNFISRATQWQFRLVTALLVLPSAALLVLPLLSSGADAKPEPPKPQESQRGSLTVLSQPASKPEQPPESSPPTPVVTPKLAQTLPPQPDSTAETEPDSEPVVRRQPPEPPQVASTPANQELASVATDFAVETLLAEYARTWEGLGNGQTDADGESAPAYVFNSMSSYLRLLRERGVVIAFNRQTEVRLLLGSSLTPKQWKESNLKSWLDLPGYSKRVSLLPPTDPSVASLRTRFLREHPDWIASNTMLVVAIPETVDATIRQAQQFACDQHGIRPNARVVTIGDLASRASGLTYDVTAIKDLTPSNRTAAR